MSVCLGHTSSPRILQRYHPIYHPAGLCKHVAALYENLCQCCRNTQFLSLNVYIILHFHIYSYHNPTSQCTLSHIYLMVFYRLFNSIDVVKFETEHLVLFVIDLLFK